MGTDWVTLFDLDLAKEVLRLDAPGLARFLDERGPGFAQRDQRNVRERNAELAAALPAMQEGFERFVTQLGIDLPQRAPDPGATRGRVSELENEEAQRAAARWDEFAERLHGGEDLGSLRPSVAWAAGMMSNPLNLDYWGCSAEALSAFDLGRTCETNLLIDPGDLDGTHVFFLFPEHVDAMIASLRAHWSEVRLMDETDLQRLVDYRKRYASQPGIRVAYHIDF